MSADVSTTRLEVPLDMVLGGRELAEPRQSPDGSVVAFVAKWGSSTAIVTVPIGGGPERIVTTEPAPAPGRGAYSACFDWLPDGSAIVYAARSGSIWIQPMPGGGARCLAAIEGRSTSGIRVSPDGASVVAAIDDAEIWSWSTADAGAPSTGERLDDGSADFVMDPFVTPCGSTLLWTAWDVPDMPWDAARVEALDLETGTRSQFVGAAAVQQPRALPDGTRLGVRDDTGWLNVWVGDEPFVDEASEHAFPTWGGGQRSYAVSPEGDRIVYCRSESGYASLCVADIATRSVEVIGRGIHTQIGWRGEHVVALRSGARTPTQIAAYAPRSWTRTVLAIGPVEGWDGFDLPEPELTEVVSEDGSVTLHARRYAAGNGRMLCWVHGGPTDQWRVEWNPRIAYWWSRGWDIVVPDPRGSTGFGRAYQRAMNGAWGRTDVDDTATIIAHCHRNGWATPASTVMMGGSSGGLTALGVLGRRAGLAAGGVVLYPVTDIAVLADESHRFEAHYTLSLVGPLDQVDRYAELSPISYADKIDVPVMIMHGDEDPVVPLSSTIAFASAMRAAGGQVTLEILEGEGHGFRQPDNKRTEYRLTGEFLARLVGRTDS